MPEPDGCFVKGGERGDGKAEGPGANGRSRKPHWPSRMPSVSTTAPELMASEELVPNTQEGDLQL